ncbi:MAG TPA: tRNA preQ1(34) S-adenosylmethionine ribosyltransferase-isomerase QueA [Anaeromyxobacteraceae bacterium]|nr:tRNA preQ1(34) S-adenosylmethionine ribosyltransferase-isomerase QueA [Anaeromyxobacteraceae bacterium]
MKISDFDYGLPEDLVAQAPVTPRDASRLLVLPASGPLEHRRFADLPELLRPGDLLVLNDTRVIPARLVGRKATGGRVEILLCEPLEGGLGRRWRALGQASKPIREGSVLSFDGLEARVERAEGDGFLVVALDREGPELEAALARAGRVPLPPYVRREPTEEDRERYQTIWAAAPGSAAAPTAGLHFTAPLLDRLSERGVERTAVTLHVGPGTFLPVRAESLDEHRLHAERYEVPPEAARAFAAARARGGRVVAVGTTAVRTLESAFEGGDLRAGAGRTELFVRPGHPFRAVDLLVTNFHLPRSTLLVLACAFGGRERVLAAYREAVRLRYRFFSYGDAMLLGRPGSASPVL